MKFQIKYYYVIAFQPVIIFTRTYCGFPSGTNFQSLLAYRANISDVNGITLYNVCIFSALPCIFPLRETKKCKEPLKENDDIVKMNNIAFRIFCIINEQCTAHESHTK